MWAVLIHLLLGKWMRLPAWASHWIMQQLVISFGFKGKCLALMCNASVSPLTGIFRPTLNWNAVVHRCVAQRSSVFEKRLLLPRNGQQVLESPSPAERGWQNVCLVFHWFIWAKYLLTWANPYPASKKLIIYKLESYAYYERGKLWNSGISEEEGEINSVQLIGIIGVKHLGITFEQNLEKKATCSYAWRCEEHSG